jgi:hypothetical protein
LSRFPSSRTNAIVVDICLPAARVANFAYVSSAGTGTGSQPVSRCGR